MSTVLTYWRSYVSYICWGYYLIIFKLQVYFKYIIAYVKTLNVLYLVFIIINFLVFYILKFLSFHHLLIFIIRWFNFNYVSYLINSIFLFIWSCYLYNISFSLSSFKFFLCNSFQYWYKIILFTLNLSIYFLLPWFSLNFINIFP